MDKTEHIALETDTESQKKEEVEDEGVSKTRQSMDAAIAAASELYDDLTDKILQIVALDGVYYNNKLFRACTAIFGTIMLFLCCLAWSSYRLYWKLFFKGEAATHDLDLMDWHFAGSVAVYQFYLVCRSFITLYFNNYESYNITRQCMQLHFLVHTIIVFNTMFGGLISNVNNDSTTIYYYPENNNLLIYIYFSYCLIGLFTFHLIRPEKFANHSIKNYDFELKLKRLKLNIMTNTQFNRRIQELLLFDGFVLVIVAYIASFSPHFWFWFAHYGKYSRSQELFQAMIGSCQFAISLGDYRTWKLLKMIRKEDCDNINNHTHNEQDLKMGVWCHIISFMLSFFAGFCANAQAHCIMLYLLKPTHWLAPIGIPIYLAAHGYYLFFKKYTK